MRLKNRFIIFSCILFSSNAQAIEVFVEPLYWRATETIDWAYINDQMTPNQYITYKTLDFNYAPGVRVGVGINKGTWDTQFYYTRYYTRGTDSTTGYLKSGLLTSRLIQAADYFYLSGQASLAINFNMLNWDFGKRFDVSPALMLRPLVGLEGGWINQTYNTSFQGPSSITEQVKNNFSGVGPKVGMEGKLKLLDVNNYQVSAFATFTTAYLLGNWKITDALNANPPKTANIIVASRDMGAVALQGIVGANLDYKNVSVKLGYEINDWLNQVQFFDDDTGGHNNDLILQGLTLGVKWGFG